ncbi:hypothetical protein DOY81_004320 [Sarcophaga bullata]|nr:hypothetical protein DOY81_004320 [Sarcophaga bullata]
MFTLPLLILPCLIRLCNAEFMPIFQTFNPSYPPLVPICPQSQHHYHGQQQLLPGFKQSLANTTSDGNNEQDKLKFLIPFMDMEIQHDRSLLIIQEPLKQKIFILHGHQLYQLTIRHEEKLLTLMGSLQGSVHHVEPIAAQIVYWQNNFILVIALEEYLEVYQLPENVLQERVEIVKNPMRAYEPPPVFEAIQQLTSFEWLNTYFEPIEELTFPSTPMANVVGSKIKYFITGRSIKHQSRTILTVFEISQSTLRLEVKQTLTVQSRVVHLFTYRNHNMIVACSSKVQKCNSFRQTSDGHFSVYRQRSSKEFVFEKLVATDNFVGAFHQNQVKVFTNHRLDCYGSFTIEQMDVTSLLGHHNTEKEDYIVLVYKRPFQTLIRMIELEIKAQDLAMGNQSEPEEMLASTRHKQVFESSVSQLRSILLQRRVDMDVLRKVSDFITSKMRKLEVTKPVTLQSGKVQIIKIVDSALRSPMQIMERVRILRQKYLSQRLKRSDNKSSLNNTFEMTNAVKVRRLKVKNLLYQGDVIEGFHLSENDSVLYVEPKAKTNDLNTVELIYPNRERSTGRQHMIPDVFLNVMPTLRVNHLWVDFINDIPWNDFFNALFLKNRDKTVQGRLIMQSPVDVNHLKTTVLNGLIVSSLFNLKYPQVILSELTIFRLSVQDLKAKTINGLIFEDDVVFSGNDSVIETPVIMHHLRISGDLLLEDNTKIERFANNTDELELKQFYTNKVIINGTLILNDLKRQNANVTKIKLGVQEFNENDLKTKYLLREEAQNFSFPIVFNDTQVTAPSLETNYLNNHRTEQHMLVNTTGNNNKPLLVVFMNSQVQGDVICRDYKSKISEINENIIHRGDKFVNLTGIKKFESLLEVNELSVSNLNHIPVRDLLFKTLLNDKPALKFRDRKSFLKIEVKKPAFVMKELKASYLNNLPLEDLFNNDYYMDRLQLPYLLETSNIVFHKINGIPFDEFFRKINVKDERLVLHKDLIVEGNVHFVEPLGLSHINNINWKVYVENLVRINENAAIEGDVHFNSDVTITKDFESLDLNGSDLEKILKNLLMKSKPQLITGLYHFDNINVTNMDVLKINNVDVKEFIDLRQNLTEFKGNVIVEHLNIEGNLQSHTNEYENYYYLKEQVERLSLRPWKNIYILNNARWPVTLNDNSQQELLKYFYKTAVKSHQNQIITGNVRLYKPLIKKMQTRLQFPPNVDIDFIQRDGLLKNSSIPQFVKGKKVFQKPLHTEELQTKTRINANFLNNIDILRLNQSLFRLSSHLPLQGPLKFLKHPTIQQLHVNGLINGLNSSLIYQIGSHGIVPRINIKELFIDNKLKIKNINDMNFDYFLDNRVTLKGPALEHFGILTFENLVIEKEALMQSINNITIDNLIFKHSDYLQTITGHKTVEKFLELAGPAHVTRINDKDLMELYRTSLIVDRNYQFDNLIIDKATFVKGLEVVGNLNNNFQQRSFIEMDQFKSNAKEVFLRFLKEFKSNLTSAGKDIMYLDYDLNTSIKWQKPINAYDNKTISYEIARISCCEKQYLQIFFENEHEIYLQNITSNRLSVITNGTSVKAENYCHFENRKVKSKITMSGNKLLKVFSMKRYIESTHVVNIDNCTDLVLLHALDLPALKRNEVRIFKILKQNNSIIDWQGLTQNIGEQLKLFKFTKLIVFITNGLIEYHPALTIYHFNVTTQHFKLKQIIDGDYDIIEMLQLPTSSTKTYHLIVSCTKCQRIFIYELSSSVENEKYKIFQMITLNSPIDKLILFSLQNDYYMLVISQRDSNFYNIYKYSNIQGWLHLSFGYFPKLQMSIPLTQLWNKDSHLAVSYDSNEVPLLILCNSEECYLLKAIV